MNDKQVRDDRLKELVHKRKCVEPEGCYHCEEIDIAQELLALRVSHATLEKEAKLWHDAHAELSILFASGEKERDSLRDVLCAYREQHRVLQGCFVDFIDSYLPSAVTHADYRCPNCKNTDELLEELDAILANAKKVST